MRDRLAWGLVVLASCGDNLAGPPDGALDAGPDIGAVPGACVVGRSLVDRPEDSGRDQIRVLYVLPSDVDDRERDTEGQICNSVRAFATWFHARSSRYLRFDTLNDAVDIGFVRLEQDDAELRGSDPSNASVETGIAFVRNRIELELGRRGLIAPNKLYRLLRGLEHVGVRRWRVFAPHRRAGWSDVPARPAARAGGDLRGRPTVGTQ
ncbi:MAG: hypothetical protein H0T79_11390 [Deltaproteobacteria bacterium]|nr:hypothetical protein [Deltaproteobacteria bacterium]